MTVAIQLEILDLRHFSARQLRPLLEHEARSWKTRLRWDYRSSTELLLQYLDSRSLPGFVALDRGRLCGFTFCVYEGNKAVVGDAYAATESQGGALSVAKLLLQQLIQLAQHTPGTERIESQLLLYDIGAIDDIFTGNGFVAFPRRFLELELSRGLPFRTTAREPANGIELVPWTGEHYQPAGELIHLAYVGHVDAQINDQYRTLHGSLRFLHNIVRFPGCGVFQPSASWVLQEEGRMVAMVLCSDVGERTAHITQICVSPLYRGQGLARRLMRHAVAHLRSAGYEAITLTVTLANVEAMHLYDELGFSARHEFNAMVWEKSRL